MTPLRALDDDGDVRRFRQAESAFGRRRPISIAISEVMQTSAKSTPSSASTCSGLLEIDARRRLERRADLLVGARDLDRAGDDERSARIVSHVLRQRVVAPFGRDRRELFEMDRAARRVARRPTPPRW